MKPPKPTERLLLLRQRRGLIWEGSGVSNPGVVRLPNETIAMVYRGCGSNNVGHLGFCLLDKEGRHVIAGSRLRQPLNQRSEAEKRQFPGGYGDPRINKVGDWYYIWANARNNERMKINREKYGNDFAGQYIGGRQTVAFRTRDFKQLEYLGLHGPDEFDKNSFLHPEPIMIDSRPHWAFFHRIQFSVQVILVPTIAHLRRRDVWRRHVDNLESFEMMRPELEWEGVGQSNWPGSIAGAAPPIRVENNLLPVQFDQSAEYWLFFYNASGGVRDGKIARDRRLGAVIFRMKTDISTDEQPFEVVARAAESILTPQKAYEFNSPNGDVVFVTGVLETLDHKAVDVFYGSGDIVISKARFDLRDLLDYICHFNEHGKLVTGAGYMSLPP